MILQNAHKELILTRQNSASKLEACINDVFNPETQCHGNKFFDSIGLKLSTNLEASYVIIGRFIESEETIESVCFCDKERNLNTIKYSTEGTPSSKTLNSMGFSFPKNVQKAFPKDQFLAKLNIEGYSGVPIFGSHRRPIGIICALFQSPIKNEQLISSLMYMFASRIGSEMIHLEKEEKLNQKNKELLIFKEELIRKNKELDSINKKLTRTTLKAQESNKLKTSFLANLSHEIRTPMNVILGFTELLKSNSLEKDEFEDFVDIIHQNGFQLMRVMDALIDISKLQAQKHINTNQITEINKIIYAFEKQYTKEIKALQKPINIRIELALPTGKDTIHTHKEALNKILDHLLQNAVKFTHSGQITLGYLAHNKDIVFYVEDTGIGIPKGEEKSIFNLFRQSETTTTREFGGNGIGLAIVKKYINLIDGTIKVDTTKQKGSRFIFSIPRN